MANRARARVIRRRIKHVRFLLSLFLVLGVLVGGYQFLNSSFFAVRSIEVQGNNALRTAEIIETSGVVCGTNIFKVDTRKVVNLLQVMPLVERVEVWRRFPDTIVINVQERTPIAVLAAQGGFVVVDRYGVYLRKLDDILGVSEPIVTGVNVDKTVGPGQAVTSPGLKTAIAVIQELDRDFLDQISEINAQDPEQLILVTLKGLNIRFGDEERVAEKQTFLKSFLADEYWQELIREIAYIDVSYSGPPVVKYHDNGREGQ